MNIASKKKIVLLGMMTRMPVAGNVWLVVQYLLGFQRLGYDVYYVEAHGSTPRELMEHETDDSTALAAAFIDRVMRRFDLGDKWAFHALHDDGRCYGMSELQLRELYRTADLIINLHGGTVPRPEHIANGRLVYLETDPVTWEIRLHHNDPKAQMLMEPHRHFFTWGLNYGHPDCKVPLPEHFHFRPSPPPVVLDFWRRDNDGQCDTFTTVGNWRQHCEVQFQGEVYHWSKHLEFLKFLDLPRATNQSFELALGSYNQDDQQLLENHGWKVRPASSISSDLDLYRRYITESRGEFTVAKDQNVRLRSGWFSERSAQYLAAGRPVITQETGFSNVLPTGRGLFGFSTLEEIVQAVECINSDYAAHSRAAHEIAEEYFAAERVLTNLLEQVGL
ncbi:MAG: hypothetical protein WKF77_04485 [Planctomycetaceae bacterium]